jgi:hypothetical protein
MKIISKYKDYYDYLVGSKFGLDDKVVLDRREGFVYKNPFSSNSIEIIKLAICDYLYYGIIYENNVYWGEERLKFISKSSKLFINTDDNKYFLKREYLNYNRENSVFLDPIKTDININEDCPIVFVSGYRNQNLSKFPSLENFKLSKILPPEIIYVKIYNWLSKRNEFHFVDNRTDIQKLESAGFDKKESFRNIKNKK